MDFQSPSLGRYREYACKTRCGRPPATCDGLFRGRCTEARILDVLPQYAYERSGDGGVVVAVEVVEIGLCSRDTEESAYQQREYREAGQLQASIMGNDLQKGDGYPYGEGGDEVDYVRHEDICNTHERGCTARTRVALYVPAGSYHCIPSCSVS